MLRIEDTDRSRFVADAETQIINSLAWLGIKPDQAPQRQSERLEVYEKHAKQLEEEGKLYPCWCSPERLAELRITAQTEKVPFKYDRHCLDNPGDLDHPHVLRFKIPNEPKKIEWEDAVKGPVEVPVDSQDDFVAIKSDGFPTYHFANVVDDHEMQITHVLRADEWLASTPKHILLYQAFGWNLPVFAHLPAVLGSGGGKKLSKREGARPVLEYKDEGYLPEAIINFLALLGWNPGEGSTKEIFSFNELAESFSLEHIQPSPATFDPDRLEWMNGLYIRELNLDELAKRAEGFWPSDAQGYPDGYKRNILAMLQERLKFLAEIPPLSQFFFSEPHIDPSTLTKNLEPSRAKEYLEKVKKALQDSSFRADDLENILRDLAGKLDVKTGQLFGLIRAAVTGTNVAPPLFDTLAVLGRERVMKRLEHAVKNA